MPTGNAVWGIDIGQCALKAIKLRAAEGNQVEAVAFDVIEHPKILSQPDADRDELIKSALEKFASRNDWQGDSFVVGVPGQQTFARFCKMPPIDLKKDAKKIPELVRYEASQQIPFDIDDVVWDYQVFTSEGSPDIEVGIFAMRKDLIRRHLAYFSEVGIAPTAVQTVPAALYNFSRFDGQTEDGAATVIVDVGAQNTDLIIVEPHAAWTRNIPLGGNSFTEALVRAFKLSFAKAENLKRSAASSKYARQIFQAMRPVFADLVAEIQRSIGFYSSTHRDVELRRVLALGNAFRLPGLQKYLENNLTIAGGVRKLEKFNRLVPNATSNAPQFTENLLTFAPAFGLAVQGLGVAQISASLLPTELARAAIWRRKRPYFIATAASLLIASSVPYVANALDMATLRSDRAKQDREVTSRIVAEARGYQERFNAARSDTGKGEEIIKKLLNLQDHCKVVPHLLSIPHLAMPPINPPQLARASTVEEFKRMVEADPVGCARTKRGQLIIESLKVEYAQDVNAVRLTGEPDSGSAAGGGVPGGARGGGMMPAGGGRGMMGGGGGRGMMGMGMMPAPAGGAPGEAPAPEKPANAGFVVRVRARLAQGETHADAIRWLTQEYFPRLREQCVRDGLGFYLPDDETNDPSITASPKITRYHGSLTGPGVGAPGVGPAGGDPSTGTVRVPDPITGEETCFDWGVEFAFKVKLGEKPPKPESSGDTAQAPGMPG